jgi:hypothetical protein
VGRDIDGLGSDDYEVLVLESLQASVQLLTEIRDLMTDFTVGQTALDAAIAQVSTDVTALLAKVNANPALAAEVAAEVSALGSSTSALTAIDTTVNPPATPVAGA